MFGIDDAIIGGLVSGGLGLLGSSMSNDANRDIANQTNQFSAEQYAKRYQTTVKDMQAAGLSPMLAYSQGAGSAPSGQVGHAQQNVMSSALEGYQKATERQMMNAQLELIREQATKANQEMLESAARTKGIDLDNTVKQLYSVDKSRQELYNLGSTADEIASRISLNNAQAAQATKNIDVMIQNIQTGHASEAQLRAQIDQLKAYTLNLGLDAKEKQAMAKMWETVGSGGAAAKTFVPFLQMLKSILGK
jgi:hypothetical protein